MRPKLILIGGLTVLLLALGSKARKYFNMVNQLQFDFGTPYNFTLTGGLYGKLGMILPVVIINNVSQGIWVEDVKIDGYHNNILIFSATYPHRFRIEPATAVRINPAVQIDIPRTVNLVTPELLQALASHITMGQEMKLNKPVDLRITATVEDLPLSLTQKITI